MKYKEAQKEILKRRWKTEKCLQETCWCLMIVPEKEMRDENNQDIYIVGAGCISKDHAEYIVNLHNDSLK